MALATYKDLCIDAVDPVLLGSFWAETLGLSPTRLDDGDLRVALAGQQLTARVVPVPVADGIDYVVLAGGAVRRLRLVDPREVSADETIAGGSLRAPMPGKIIDIRVKDGETVRRGQPVIVLEAMKMEHTLTAPDDGTVKRVKFAVGDQVEEGVELCDFEAAGP